MFAQVSSASIVGATIWEYEFVRDQVKKMMDSTVAYFHNPQKNVGTFKIEIFNIHRTPGGIWQSMCFCRFQIWVVPGAASLKDISNKHGIDFLPAINSIYQS